MKTSAKHFVLAVGP